MRKLVNTSLLLSMLLLSACSTDNNKRKLSYLSSGNRYLSQGKYEEAAAQYREAIRIDGRFAAAHSRLGQAYLGLKNPEAASREFSATAALEPGNVEARLSLATLRLDRRQYAEAGLILKQVLGAHPENSLAHALLGRKYLATHDLTGAIREMEKVVQLNAGDARSEAALAATYMAAGRAADAESAYKRAAAANPRAVEAQIDLGEFYYSQKRLGEAETALRAACGLDLPAVLPRLLLGRTLMAQGRMADAEKTFAMLKSVAPNDPRALQALGAFYSNTGQKEKALAEFQRLAAARPRDSRIRAWVIETLVDLNRIAEATPMIQAALGKSAGGHGEEGDESTLLISRGRILIAGGKYPEAISTLRKVTEAEPDYARAHYYLAIAQKAAGELAPAKASFARSLALAPDMSQAAAALASLDLKDGGSSEALRKADQAIAANPALAAGYVARGRALIAAGDTSRGEQELEQALQREPLNLAALSALVNVLINQGKAAEAARRIGRLVQENDRNAGLHFLLGLGRFSLNDLDGAEASTVRAIALDPKTPQVWTLMANIDFSRGRAERGKTDLRNAIAASPRTISNYSALGAQYERENNWDEAKRLFETAHDLDRQSPFVAAELAYLYLEHGGDVNVALSLAQQARERMPDSAITADALGWAYYKLGSTDLSVKQLEESVRKTPSNPVYLYHLGMAYAKSRQWEKATGSLQSALRRDPNFPYAASARTTLDQIRQHAK